MSSNDLLSLVEHFDAVVDCRSPSEYAEDHIPGAVSAPVLDDAVIQRGVDPRIGRRARDRAHPVHVVERPGLLRDALAVVNEEINRGLRRQHGQLRFQVRPVQIVDKR